MLWLCFKLPYCLFGNIRDTSVVHKEAKFVCFIYMQPQKVKFKYVQINMKQVSYEYKFNFWDEGLYLLRAHDLFTFTTDLQPVIY